MGDDKTVHECYQYNADTRLMVEKLEDRVIDELQEIREKLINRLPAWATFVISFLTMTVGSLITLALKH